MNGSILIKNMTFSYLSAVNPIFKGVNLNINECWKLGLVGRNGRGKTTFLKILLNQLPYEGVVNSGLNFKYFPCYPGIEEDITALELLQQNHPNIETWELERELNYMKLPPELLNRKFNILSGGEQTKLLLVELFLDEHTFPLIDEPTNNLDLQGREIVGQYLDRKNGYIVVSHDEYFLNHFVDHVLSINKESIDLITGNVDTWKYEKENADKLVQEKNSKLKGEINRLNNVSSRVNEWGMKRENSTKDASERRLAAKQMKRAKAIRKRTENLIEEKQKLINNIEETPDLKLNVKYPSKQVLYLKDFSILRNGVPLFEPINLDLHPNERLFIEGENGVGKSSLLNFILGNEHLDCIGEYELRLPLHQSTLHQNNQDGLDFSEMINQINSKKEKEQYLNLLRQLGIERSRFSDQSSHHWSSGEKKKVFLANALLGENELMIWDEVTNSLDIMAINQLIETILNYQPTMIGVDHNEYYVDKLATKKIELIPTKQ